jgi:hypothetical protein
MNSAQLVKLAESAAVRYMDKQALTDTQLAAMGALLGGTGLGAYGYFRSPEKSKRRRILEGLAGATLGASALGFGAPLARQLGADIGSSLYELEAMPPPKPLSTGAGGSSSSAGAGSGEPSHQANWIRRFVGELTSYYGGPAVRLGVGGGLMTAAVKSKHLPDLVTPMATLYGKSRLGIANYIKQLKALNPDAMKVLDKKYREPIVRAVANYKATPSPPKLKDLYTQYKNALPAWEVAYRRAHGTWVVPARAKWGLFKDMVLKPSRAPRVAASEALHSDVLGALGVKVKGHIPVDLSKGSVAYHTARPGVKLTRKAGRPGLFLAGLRVMNPVIKRIALGPDRSWADAFYGNK